MAMAKLVVLVQDEGDGMIYHVPSITTMDHSIVSAVRTALTSCGVHVTLLDESGPITGAMHEPMPDSEEQEAAALAPVVPIRRKTTRRRAA